MTLQLEVVGPCLVLLAGGLMLLLRPIGAIFVLTETAALGLLLRLWQLSGPGSLVLPIYQPLPNIDLVLQVDPLGLAFALAGVGVGLLVSLPWVLHPVRRQPQPLGWLMLAQAAMVNVCLAGGLETMAAGWAMTVMALVIATLAPAAVGGRRPGRDAMFHLAAQVTGATLLLLGAVTVEVSSGTGAFSSVPVGALDLRACLLVAAAPVLSLAALGAMMRALRDPLAGTLALGSAVMPAAAYILAVLYDLGDGRLPDTRINTALMLIGGVAAVAYAVTSLWAPDLGSADVRILQAGAALTLVAAGAGSALGMLALLLASLSVSLGAAALMSALDAGQGRLPVAFPARAVPVRVAGAVAAVLSLAWVAGFPVGLALESRLATLRAGFDAPELAAVAAVPALAAILLMPYAAYAVGRFAGPAGAATTPVVRLLLTGGTLVAATVVAPWLVMPRLVPIAAAALRRTPAEVGNAIATTPPGATVAWVVAVLLVVGLAIAVRPGSPLQLDDGLPGAPAYLPPRQTVAPAMAFTRAAESGRRLAAAASGLVGRRLLLASVLAAAAAAGLVSSLLR